MLERPTVGGWELFLLFVCLAVFLSDLSGLRPSAQTTYGGWAGIVWIVLFVLLYLSWLAVEPPTLGGWVGILSGCLP